MPKGVEHREVGRAVGDFQSLLLPLMPKGVEHFVRLSPGSRTFRCFFL